LPAAKVDPKRVLEASILLDVEGFIRIIGGKLGEWEAGLVACKPAVHGDSVCGIILRLKRERGLCMGRSVLLGSRWRCFDARECDGTICHSKTKNLADLCAARSCGCGNGPGGFCAGGLDQTGPPVLTRHESRDGFSGSGTIVSELPGPVGKISARRAMRWWEMAPGCRRMSREALTAMPGGRWADDDYDVD